jgi:hypothetical protein
MGVIAWDEPSFLPDKLTTGLATAVPCAITSQLFQQDRIPQTPQVRRNRTKIVVDFFDSSKDPVALAAVTQHLEHERQSV